MRRISLTHSYDVSPDRLWALVVDFDALAYVMRSKVTFEGLPKGRVQAGQAIDVQVSLFGKLPLQPYHMEVLVCDDSTYQMRSAEAGAGVRSWLHSLQITPTETGSQLSETIEIDAGWMTWAFALWARHIYRARHAPRLELLAEGRF